MDKGKSPQFRNSAVTKILVHSYYFLVNTDSKILNLSSFKFHPVHQDCGPDFCSWSFNLDKIQMKTDDFHELLPRLARSLLSIWLWSSAWALSPDSFVVSSGGLNYIYCPYRLFYNSAMFQLNLLTMWKKKTVLLKIKHLFSYENIVTILLASDILWEFTKEELSACGTFKFLKICLDRKTVHALEQKMLTTGYCHICLRAKQMANWELE